MQTRVIPIAIVISLIIIGWIDKCLELRRLNGSLTYTRTYNNEFTEMINMLFKQKKLDNNLYSKLIKNVDHMQMELGADGIIAEMIDPLKNVRYRNYQILINFMTELVQGSEDLWIMGDTISNTARVCNTVFLRHIGNLESYINNIEKTLFNPFSCFAQGIRLVICIPICVLYWCGLISKNKCSSLRNGWFSRLVQNIIVIIGLVSSIVTIILGWDQFFEILRKYLIK